MATKTVSKLSVRDRLAQLAQHVAGLRSQATAIGESDDPVAAAKRLAAISAELTAAQMVEAQIRATVDDAERAEHDARQAERDAKAIGLRPRERASFAVVVTKCGELEAAINELYAVQFELASVGSGTILPTLGGLPSALAGLKQVWPTHMIGREALGLPAEPSARETRIAELHAGIDRCKSQIESLKAARNENNYTTVKRLIEDTETTLKSIQLDLAVFEGKATYPAPATMDMSNLRKE